MKEQIEDLKREIQSLQPLSQEQIQSLVDAGQDPDQVLQQERVKARELEGAQLKLNALSKKYGLHLQMTAGSDFNSQAKELDSVKNSARNELIKLVKAVDTLESALRQFEQHSKTAADIGTGMMSLKRQHDLSEATPTYLELGSPVFAEQLKRVRDLLEPKRNNRQVTNILI